MVYPTPRHVREMAIFVVDTEEGEQAQYHLRLSELPGRWNVFLMELPWSGRETENTYKTAAQACAAADRLYEKGAGAGVWKVTRWGWERPPQTARDRAPDG